MGAQQRGNQREVPTRVARVASFLLRLCALGLLVVLLPDVALAAKKGGVDLTAAEGPATQPIPLMGALSALSLLPFAFIMVTSFVKIAVVMAIVRQAIGTNQVPPTQVITGLSLILTIYVMHPTMLRIKRLADAEADKHSTGVLNTKDPAVLKNIAANSVEPVRAFLVKHAHAKDRQLFYNVAQRMETPEGRRNRTIDDMSVLIPAFVLSELTEAFQIGFIIFLPFVLIDMTVSNVLMALGMQMLQPTTVSLPFKILLFILSDGWYMLTKGLLLGYQ